MLKICVAGAAGRMGTAIIQEAKAKGISTVGAIEAPKSPVIGKTLKELGISDQDTRIMSADEITQAAKDADVYISFTAPTAEMQNLPAIVKMGKKIVLGTTGFTEEQNKQIRNEIKKVPTVFSPNYSVGVNVFFKIAQILKAFPEEYNCSISEIHHNAKKDAPSGTALKLGEIIADARGYSKLVHGREGISIRKPEDLEIVSMRAGGVPGIHDLIIAGPFEMLRIEHTAFSRSVLAQGAVVAAEWIAKQEKPEIYTMATVLGL
ncbi:MAG: 4-hydroxy-tetrahydrodipicolinate reductase [Crenarchaeota archaeon]|nr:4-hydroxy-tetrahydrodipicolinate reductase [Thermoproteota archaeon]